MSTGGIVQSLWIGNRLSAMGRLSLESFLAHGHEVHLYCYEPVDGVPAAAVLRDAAEILPRDQVFAYRSGFGKGSYSAGSNFFRYKLLLDRGGWWVDTDVVCLQPFDFPGEHVLATEIADPDTRAIVAASCVIKQPPGSALMRWAWRVCRQQDPEHLQWGQVGPRLLFDSIKALGWQDDMRLPAVFNPIPHYDWEALIDPARAVTFGRDVYAVHLWHQMWRQHGQDPDGSFPEASLYERLKRRYLKA